MTARATFEGRWAAAHGRRVGTFAGWTANAARRLGWRHLLLAILIELAAIAFQPLGGIWLNKNWSGPADPVLAMLSGAWFFHILPMIFAALVADEAHDAGVRPAIAYGVAWLVCSALLPFAHTRRYALERADFGLHPFSLMLFLDLSLIGGALLAVWGHHHVTQRATQLAQQAETERARHRQRLHSARLATLQARIEPQLLFDALSRVDELSATDPERADRLLTDMIGLLRQMLPQATDDSSTVAREFALAGAWLRVQGHLGVAVPLTIGRDDEVAGRPLAPMLVLPMVRSVLGSAPPGPGAWRLGAAVATVSAGGVSQQRLQIALVQAPPGPGASTAQPPDGVATLRGRVAQLYGAEGAVVWSRSADRLTLTLDIPLNSEAAP